MRARLAILLAAAACAAGAEDFTLDGGIVATTAPDGGVTFRAGDATLSFAPFECAPSENGAKPVLTFRADGDALVAEVAGDPAAFGRVSFGRCSAMPKELYFGYGYCVRDPGRLHVPLNGHHNATRFAGFTFANGLSLVLATTTAPDALFVDPEKGAFGFACSQPTRFTFVPGRAGAFDCALRARRHFAEKAPRGFAAKAGRFCVDTWNGAFAQHERLIRRCAEYGLRDDLLFYVHCWQRYGFDRHLPDVYPPSPTFGTAAELKRACATAHANGWSFGVHLNVIDCYTNSPWFDWSKISHDAKGRPIKAWINPPYQERSYRLLPKFAPASISYQVESLLADGFCPDTVFVDVTGSGAMSSGTCRDAAGRVHPLISNTAANGRMFDTARALLEGAGKRPAFVSSEAPCDYLAGYMDGGDCQWMFLSHEQEVYRWMTVGGTGLVTKVPWMPLVWHDRLSLHGAGYSARFEGARGEDCHGIDSDDYISCEIMNGHSLMADCYNRDAYKAEAGILDAIDEPRCLRQIVRKYWLAQHVIREIGAASVQGVSFPDGDLRHVKVVWSTGLTVFVNRDVRDWTVATDDARVGEVILPQYGFVAFNPKTGNYASIRRRGRRVVEESAYRDGAKTVRYVNPRGADTARNRLPLAPATTVCRSGDHFSATVNWQPFGGMSAPKETFRVSLWLLDPMFREYSPKDAALRVATADVTLDQPTRFSFAWPKGVKGPRVVHVAVAPAGADADNPDVRFKLLGTSAFYRRYRQGALTAKGTWTPYRCPDENLWERLFPPTEPVDYGWITTDEAFRLISELGKPDVKITLPARSADEAVVLPNGRRVTRSQFTGHRGEARSLPENTLMAFRHAVDNGFCFECDFYMTNDGEVYCVHDMNLKRTFGIAGLATNVCWKGVLDQVDVGAIKGPQFAGRADCRVPRIDEVFALIPDDGRKITLEVKDPRPEIVALIQAAWRRHPNVKEENIIFLAHKATRAALVKAFPRATYQHCVNCYANGWKKGCRPIPLEKQLAELDARPECTNYSPMFDLDLLPTSYIDAVHARGRTFYTWCVDRPEDALEVFQRGVDGICSNCPLDVWEGLKALCAQPGAVRLWDGGAVPRAAELKQPAEIEFSVITKNEPQVDGYNWLHGVALCWHKGRLYASYGRNRGQENTPTEEMHVRASDDGGKTWGPVQVVATGGAGCGVSHGSFASHDGVLWCFAGTFSNKCSFVHTRAFTLDEASGKWVPRGVVAGAGFWPMQAPQRLPDGNWIMGGLRVANGWNLPGGARPAAAISHGDDFTKWDVSVVGKGEVARCWGEATVDTWGPCVTLTMRPGWNAQPSVAYVATSADGGGAWTALKPTNLPLATSKPFTGVLSTGQRYVISQTTADGGTCRSPLTIAVSRPGEWAYSRVYLIRHAVFPEGPGASHPKAALAYPYAVEHAGKLYVGYSNSNGGGNFRNSAELAVIPVASLK